jgi:hypothetical protein
MEVVMSPPVPMKGTGCLGTEACSGGITAAGALGLGLGREPWDADMSWTTLSHLTSAAITLNPYKGIQNASTRMIIIWLHE